MGQITHTRVSNKLLIGGRVKFKASTCLKLNHLQFISDGSTRLRMGNPTRYRCKFRPSWLDEEEDENGDKLSQYIIPDKDDKHRAICMVCFTSVNVAYQGKAALMQHARGSIHKQRMKLKNNSPSWAWTYVVKYNKTTYEINRTWFLNVSTQY